MTDIASPHVARDLPPQASGSAAITAARLVIGLCQGVCLFGLYHCWDTGSWPASMPMVFRPLLLLALMLPAVVITGLGHMGLRQLLAWAMLLMALMAMIGVYDTWRADLGAVLDGAALDAWRSQKENQWSPSFLAMLLVASGLFIAQSMVLAGVGDKRLIARYQSYFDVAWKLALQIALALLFCLMLWLVLSTGVALFELLKLDVLQKLLRRPWFTIPVFALAFASALHMTDVRPAIIAGVRKLLLTVLSWLLPVCVLIVLGFLISLAFTGLAPLWQTRCASAVLLGTCALLVVLINVLYQDGLAPGARRTVAAVLRLACLLPLPLAALGIYAMALRVAQYGWTVSRVTAALTMFMATLYAIGYALAAVRRRQPMTLVANTNVAASVVMLGLIMAILSPLADPARIAVADQLARVLDGKTAAADLDAQFWRFDSERYGVQALHTLQRTPGEHARWMHDAAQRALRLAHQSEIDISTPEAIGTAANLRAIPLGSALPAGFATTGWKKLHGQQWHQLPACLRQPGVACDVVSVHLPAQAQPHALLFDEIDNPFLFVSQADGWRLAGRYEVAASCRKLMRQAAEHGELLWQRPPMHDLLLGGVQLRLEMPYRRIAECPAPAP